MENENLNQQPVTEKKQFRNRISFASGGLLIYSVIMYAVVIVIMIAYMVIQGVLAGIRHETPDIDLIMSELEQTDMGMGIAVIIGCIFLLLFNIKRIKPKQIFEKRRTMTAPKFVMLVCVLMCIQLPISLLDIFFEAVLNQFGLSAQMAIESASAGSTTISMMLYAGFIGPFAEEFVYRGYTMRSLENTGAGKGYALVISSLLFGIMHANPTQSIYAFFAGMVFGYTAMEYGIIWSMLLHIMNNFVFGDVMTFICNHLSYTAGEILSWGMLIGLFIAGIIVLIAKRKQTAEYIRENYRTEGRYYGWTFSNVLFLLFIIINIILAVTMITELEQ